MNEDPQRWSHFSGGMEPRGYGEYVTAADHDRIVAAKEAEIAKLRERIKELESGLKW